MSCRAVFPTRRKEDVEHGSLLIAEEGARAHISTRLYGVGHGLSPELEPTRRSVDSGSMDLVPRPIAGNLRPSALEPSPYAYVFHLLSKACTCTLPSEDVRWGSPASWNRHGGKCVPRWGRLARGSRLVLGGARHAYMRDFRRWMTSSKRRRGGV